MRICLKSITIISKFLIIRFDHLSKHIQLMKINLYFHLVELLQEGGFSLSTMTTHVDCQAASVL